MPPQPKHAAFAFAGLDCDRGLAGASGKRIAGRERARQSPIAYSSLAAVITLLGSSNSERKISPSGCSRTAVGIWRSSCLIWATSGLSAATTASTSCFWRPGVLALEKPRKPLLAQAAHIGRARAALQERERERPVKGAEKADRSYMVGAE